MPNVRFVHNPDFPPKPPRGLRALLLRIGCPHQMCYDVPLISPDGRSQGVLARQCARCGARGFPRP